MGGGADVLWGSTGCQRVEDDDVLLLGKTTEEQGATKEEMFVVVE